MKYPKEIKLWINRQRKRYGKKNGVVSWIFENPRIERMIGTNKRNFEKQ
jgi:hypothetical protein